MRARRTSCFVALALVAACSSGRSNAANQDAASASTASSAATTSAPATQAAPVTRATPAAPSSSVATHPSDAASAAATPADPPAAGSAAPCLPRRVAESGRTDSTISVGGASARHYVLYLPDSYDGSQPTPLVFNFHGYGASADQQLLYSGLVSTAERNNFAVVALDGQGARRHYNQRPTSYQGEVSDIVVVVALLDKLSEQLCVDADRVYATGMSDGGALAAALGCFAADRFAAVAPVGALVYTSGCEGAAPVPIMAFRGTADDIVPYAGGRVGCCGNPVVNSTEADIASWARHNQCESAPKTSRAGSVETSMYTGCAANADVVLHTIVGGGHTWPGAIGLPGLGVTTRDIKASPAMWEFFAAHPRLARR